MTNTDKRNWLQFEFEVDAEQEDLASWLMIQNGSTGCEIAPVDKTRVLVKANFEEEKATEEHIGNVKALLEEYGLAPCLKTLRVKTIADEDWLAKWKEGYKPFNIGSMFLVCPPWLKDELTAEQLHERHLVLIEPGMAFGTGLHATTRYCMEAMEHFAVPDDVLDVGTGSGILAIAAGKLNPSAKIIAVDTDPESIRVATENLELNNTKNVKLVQGSTEVLDNQTFDLILSNLTCEDNVALMIDYLRLLRPAGRIICAGILVEKLNRLEDAIATYPLKVVDKQLDDKWAGITLERIPVTIGR
ncbi:MAG: 50S ribosomal protein L11 methyltransferase [Candidatus Obscuribacterales bacterium]|nr:50S ribosomal protein L11 methyltransferase [Candidatus Obscuribacterales bacterium]